VLRYLLGYVFDSAEAILPHLELPRVGPTSQFCKELAERLSCYVVAGYPERLGLYENSTTLAGEYVYRHPENQLHAQMQVGANSAVMYNPSGECVLEYRKTHMFETDVTWAKPGTYPFSAMT
jgi:protein N-terminal amidase